MFSILQAVQIYSITASFILYSYVTRLEIMITFMTASSNSGHIAKSGLSHYKNGKDKNIDN